MRRTQANPFLTYSRPGLPGCTSFAVIPPPPFWLWEPSQPRRRIQPHPRGRGTETTHTSLFSGSWSVELTVDLQSAVTLCCHILYLSDRKPRQETFNQYCLRSAGLYRRRRRRSADCIAHSDQTLETPHATEYSSGSFIFIRFNPVEERREWTREEKLTAQAPFRHVISRHVEDGR